MGVKCQPKAIEPSSASSAWRPTISMPIRPLRPCASPGCGELVASGACTQHRLQRERRRGSAAKRGYGTRHQRQRKIILARDPICRGCQRAESTIDDHIVRIQDGGSATDDQNQQGLCVDCHGFKTVREERDPPFGMRLRAAGQQVGEPAPYGWRNDPQFGGRQ